MADPVMILRSYLKKPDEVIISDTDEKISFGQNVYDLKEAAVTLGDNSYSFGQIWLLIAHKKFYHRKCKELGLKPIPREERKKLEDLFTGDSV